MKKIIPALVMAVLVMIIGVRAFAGAGGESTQDKPTAAPTPPPAAGVAWDTTQTENAPETALELSQEVEADATQEPEWIEAVATAYCSCEKCCGDWALNRPDGIVYTASGSVAQTGVTIAADWSVFPPGTVVYIDGIGERTVQDRGAAVKGNHVDLYFEDHDEALVFGRQTVRLYVVEGGDAR